MEKGRRSTKTKMAKHVTDKQDAAVGIRKNVEEGCINEQMYARRGEHRGKGER